MMPNKYFEMYNKYTLGAESCDKQDTGNPEYIKLTRDDVRASGIDDWVIPCSSFAAEMLGCCYGCRYLFIYGYNKWTIGNGITGRIVLPCCSVHSRTFTGLGDNTLPEHCDNRQPFITPGRR